MEPTGDDSGAWRVAADLVGPGRTEKFRLRRGGRSVEGFIVNVDGSHHAYVNRCPHAGTPLDTWPNEFLSEDGTLLVCSTHGAVFEPATGLCVEGPCPGARLERLPVVAEDGLLVVRCPG